MNAPNDLHPGKRILFAIPMNFGPRWGFWTRDSGLVVLMLRNMGYDARLVALGDSTTETEGQPVLPISLSEMQSPEWWRSQKPDAVVLCTWSAPRYDAIRKAALAATPRVVERLDTDGIRSARLFPAAYLIRSWAGKVDNLPPYARWLAFLTAAARTALLYAFPQLMDARMVATMRQLPAITAESPIAAERIQQMFKTFGSGPHRVVMIPHPVNEEAIAYQGQPKENRIITVGRWASAQKDYSMLQKVLRGFLERHPDWEATVVGSGVPAADRAAAVNGEGWQRRVTFHDNLTHDLLMPEYSRSKIYLMVSRFESFCIAAAEALCCGCSVVGSVEVPSSYYFAQNESGTVAPHRTSASFLETLDLEVACWGRGGRNPKAIAAVSREQMGARAVAEANLALFAEIVPWDGFGR
jgi:glycosyltransferase involved in cell wall biosynthesis